MNREEYEAARAGLLSNPPRHLKVAGEQPTSIEELDALAARAGLLAVQASAPAPDSQPETLQVGQQDPEPLSVVVITEVRTMASEIIAHIDRRFDELHASLAGPGLDIEKARELIHRVWPPESRLAPEKVDATVTEKGLTREETEPSTPPPAPKDPLAAASDPSKDPPPPAPASQAPAPRGATGESGDKPTIPENLGTLSYNGLRALAKSLGISPAPNTQQALLEAIEQARAAGAG